MALKALATPVYDAAMNADLDEELASAERFLDGVAHALQALDEGRYGACATCGEPIEATLLEADPLRGTCDAHLEFDPR